jgi:amino acid adenylation domain-containing protein
MLEEILHTPSTHFPRNNSPLIVPRRSQGPAPASFVQESFWTVEQVTPDSGAYNEPWALRLRGSLDQEALAASLEELCQRHSALRTTLVVQAGQLTQHITDSIPRLQLVNVSSIPQKRRASELARRAREFVRAPFDLAHGPLLRMVLLKFAPDDHILLCCAHHAIIDGWSVGIFIEDLQVLYEAYRAKREAVLPPISLDMGDFAAWQQGWLTKDVLDQLIAYWRTQLQDCPRALELPTDFPRPPIQSQKGNHIAVHLTEEIATWAHRFAQQENATPFMVMLSAFAILLSKYAQQQEFAIGTSVAGRRPELETVMGCFVHTLPLRINLSGRPSFRDVVRNVREVTLEAFEHQDVSFEKLVEELQVERDLSRMPIMQVMFAFLNVPTADLTLSDLTVSYEDVPAGMAKFDLTLFLREERGRFVGVLEYATDLFEESSMHRMREHLQLLLEQVISDPDQPLDHLRLLSAQQQQLLSQINATNAPLPAPTFLHLFSQIVQQTPHAPALVFEDHQWSYLDLDSWATQIAAHLQAAGVGRETRVGVLLPRTPLLIASLLGIWKAGAAFVPLDPTAPIARTLWIVEDAQVSLLISHSSHCDQLPSSLSVLTEVDLATTPTNALQEVASDPHDLAYVIYTSGSTGTPKGVLVEHVGLPNLAAAQQAILAIRPGDRVLQFASFTFDAAISEVTLALANSASLVLGSSLDLMPGEPLAHFLKTNRITHGILVPSALAQLPVQVFADLRVICVAGEVLFFNLYGPTEASIWTSWARILPNEIHRPAIGLPIPNTQVYVLDEQFRPAPFGLAGELYIGGIGLARGYQGRPDLTQERFLPHPFSSSPSARLYKTGDRVRWRADGLLEFLGRLDEQVKVRGYRIEPGEIEAVLNAYPSILQSAVVVQKDEAGHARLIAYLLGNRPEEEEKIIDFLRAHLPSYMLPSLLVTCNTFPHTSSGKIDRKALEKIPLSHTGQQATELVDTLSPLEEQVATIMTEVLGGIGIGRDDNFFYRGGHSLTAIRLMSRIRTSFSAVIPLGKFFRNPSIRRLAQLIQEYAPDTYREVVDSENPVH